MNAALDSEGKFILDSTCSFVHTARSARWPAFASIRMDKRKEVKPDLVADARYLPFREKLFDEIYCDPPHMYRKNPDLTKIWRARHFEGASAPPGLVRFYFWSSPEEWYNFLDMANSEFARTIKLGETLHFKITDGDSSGLTKTEDLVRLTNFKESKRVQKSKSTFKNRVHFLTLEVKQN